MYNLKRLGSKAKKKSKPNAGLWSPMKTEKVGRKDIVIKKR